MSQSQSYVEKVRPDNGSRESGWVFLTIAVILLIGGFGISQHQQEKPELPEHLTLGIADKAILTALRNAGDEIQFMLDDAQTLPTPDQLREELVPPFVAQPGLEDTHYWRLFEQRCYIGEPTAARKSSMRFLLTFDGEVSVYWQLATAGSHSHGSVCNVDEHWQVFKNA